MGLESYLFYVKFDEEVSELELDQLLISIGLNPVKKVGKKLSDFRSYYYELITEKGITEAHCLFSPDNKMGESFYLRFSICSPVEVIDQTFMLLDNLNSKQSIRVKDTEIYNHYCRRERQEGKVDASFKGLTKSENQILHDKSYISIDPNEFKKNKLGIMKRNVLLQDDGNKAIVRGDSETFLYLEKKSLIQKFMGWITKEL